MLHTARESAGLTLAARRAVGVLTQQQSPQPERELLLADASRAVEQQARRKRTLRDR